MEEVPKKKIKPSGFECRKRKQQQVLKEAAQSNHSISSFFKVVHVDAISVIETIQSSASTSKQPIQPSIESQVIASYILNFMLWLMLIDLIYHLIKINCKNYRTFVVKKCGTFSMN